MKFDEAGGGRGVSGEVGPSAVQAGSAMQAVGHIGRAGKADEQTAAAVTFDFELDDLLNLERADIRAIAARRVR